MRLPDSRFSILDSPREGFTLIETLIFIVIFSLTIITFLSVFVTVTNIQARQSSASEVATQTQFLLQTLQYYIERASAVDITADTATSTLKLRMPSAAEDPAIIQLNGSTVTLQLAGGAVKNLTSSKVNVTGLQFTRRTNPPGHDSVSIALTMAYNTQSLAQNFVQSLTMSVSRAAAATFDSNVVPSAANTYSLGTGAAYWQSINGTIYFSGSNVGVGNSSPSPNATLEVIGSGSDPNGDLYLYNAGKGVIFKGPNGTSCYLLTITNTGAFATSSITCP